MKRKGILFLTVIVLSAILASSFAYAPRPSGVPPQLEKRVFIHYRKGYAKPPWAGGGKNKEDPLYKLLGRGVKWTSTVDVLVDPSGSGLTDTYVLTTFATSAEIWDGETSYDLFGSATLTTGASWDSKTPDGTNELLFGDYPDGNVIAVTIIWGYFSGSPQSRRITEFDILFDTDWNWGDAGPTDEVNLGDTTVMDLQNIATHELGHGFGLGDLYTSSSSEQTMYGYSGNGETKKRTLNDGDIAGLQELYGQ